MDLLAVFERSNAEMPNELARVVDTWITGYRGTDTEPTLRGLFQRIPVGQPAEAAERPARRRSRAGATPT
jgi:hypothetical protein